MPEQKIGRLRASYLLTVESFEFLRQDKEMLLLPFFSFFANLLVLLVVGAIFFGLVFTIPETAFDGTAGDVVIYGCLFLAYIGFAFVLTFFQGAIAAMVRMRIGGGDPMLRDGLRACTSRCAKIFRWSLFSATVGLVLRIIGDKLGWAGRIFDFVGSVAWSVLTFFMVPVLVLEDLPMKASLKRSGQLFRETWGETLIMNFSLGLFIGLVDILWIIACLVAGYFAFVSGNYGLLVIIGCVFLGVFLLLAIVSSVLGAIFKTVLYEYAASGRVPATFTPELIIGAIKRKQPATAAL